MRGDLPHAGKGSAAGKASLGPTEDRADPYVQRTCGTDFKLLTRVSVISGPHIVLERPMCFTFRGWDGGHDVIGILQNTDTLGRAPVAADSRVARSGTVADCIMAAGPPPAIIKVHGTFGDDGGICSYYR